MRLLRTVSLATVSLALVLPVFAQQTDDQTRKQTRSELKQQQKADKKQAKADKAEAKALNTKEAKKAAKAQDRANGAQPQ